MKKGIAIIVSSILGVALLVYIGLSMPLFINWVSEKGKFVTEPALTVSIEDMKQYVDGKCEEQKQYTDGKAEDQKQYTDGKAEDQKQYTDGKVATVEPVQLYQHFVGIAKDDETGKLYCHLTLVSSNPDGINTYEDLYNELSAGCIANGYYLDYATEKTFSIMSLFREREAGITAVLKLPSYENDDFSNLTLSFYSSNNLTVRDMRVTAI